MTMHNDSIVGTQVDDYRILEVLGQGGMGVVYKAKNLALDRMEALKVIAPQLVQNTQFLRRFQLEAKALARIHHPNIVTVYTLRHSELGYYITMEYVEGQTLADVVAEQGRLAWKQALPIFKQLLTAFEYAHERGIIHRDIKPRNIMLTPEGAVKVMDFGLAKFYQQQDATRTQGVSGTVYYMSPEQIKGSSNLDQRSDIFSLGMTMYEIVLGQLPFNKDDSQFSIQRSIVEEDFSAPHRVNEAVPERLSDIIMNALEKEPQHRYQVAGEMLEALDAFETEMREWEAEAPTKTQPVRAVREDDTVGGVRRRWGAFAVLALVVGGIIWGVYAFGPAVYERWAGQDDASSEVAEASISEAGEVDARQEGEGEAGAVQGEADSQNEAGTQEAGEPDASNNDPSGQEAAPSDQTGDDAGGGTDDRQTDEEATPPVEPSEARETDPDTQTEQGPDDAAPSTENPPGDRAGEAAPQGDGETQEETTSTPSDTEGRDNTEQPAREEPAEPEVTLADVVERDADVLRGMLKRAVLEDDWGDVPAPLATYYTDKLDDLSSRFEIDDVGVDVEQRNMRTVGTQASVPVTVYIAYRQKGRESLKSFPIPSMWIWRGQGDTYQLAEIQDR